MCLVSRCVTERARSLEEMLRCCVLALTRCSSGKPVLILPQPELQPMPNMCSPVFLHSPRCFNPGRALRLVTQASDVRAHASSTQKRTCRLLCLSERTCFQWKPESTLPRGPGVDRICGSRWGGKKTGSVSARSCTSSPLKVVKQISNRRESKLLLRLAEIQLANTESVLLQNPAQPARAGNKDLALHTWH